MTPSSSNATASLTFDGLDVIYSIARLLASGEPLDDILNGVLKVMAEKAGLKRGMIAILREGEDELAVDVSHGLSEAERRKGRYKRGEGVTGQVVSSGRPIAIPRLSDAPRFLDRTGARRNLNREDLAFLCVPIRAKGEVIGAMSADRAATEQSMVLDEEVRFLESVADLIGQVVLARRNEERKRIALEKENLRLKAALGEQERPSQIIGDSEAMQSVYQQIAQVSDSHATVLISGPTGTGKEIVARTIHQKSRRKNAPFVAVNCAALSETLLESELFGHEAGAFTGALRQRMGSFEAASGGTIFLDEIGEFPPSAQMRLLRVLQEREIQRVGSSHPIKIDVRVIAATHRDLEKDITEGRFRQDLYYRLNVFPIHLPDLVARGADVLLLAEHFVHKYAEELRKKIDHVCQDARDVIASYNWPGNVRELENCIERAVLLSTDGCIHAYHFPASVQGPKNAQSSRGGSLADLVESYEHSLIEAALRDAEGNQSEAARSLGTTKRVIQYKTQKYGIDWQTMRQKLPDP